jgi:hypothetical protein
MSTNFKITGAQQLEDLQKRLKVAGDKELGKSMRKHLTAATKPVVKDVRAAVLATPSKGASGGGRSARDTGKRKNGGGLRAAIARGVRSKITTSGKNTSVSVKVDASKLPADQRELPKYMEGLKPWRHPLFGDTEHWYPQASHPFFFKTVRAHEHQVQDEVKQVLTDVAKQIEK